MCSSADFSLKYPECGAGHMVMLRALARWVAMKEEKMGWSGGNEHVFEIKSGQGV